jgi:alkaline phosphatase D
MSKVPTYMILDDHEIEDNWPTKSNRKDFLDKYPQAIHAYQTYQVSHSPVLEMIDGKAQNPPDKYWYSFENGCSDFFVMDTRTERHIDQVQPANSLIVGNKQLKELKNWLSNDNKKVKFVVSGVPFFPDLSSAGVEDKWGGFLIQRSEVLNYIKDKKIKRVVFLSGDVHCSLYSQLISKSDPEFKVTSIISSSFFWPYPHETEKNFQLSGSLNTLPQTQDFEIVNVSDVITDDNFVRLTVSKTNILFESFGRKGDPIGSPLSLDI